MIQNSETNPSFVPNEMGQSNGSLENVNLDGNTNQQPSPFMLCNPPKIQRKMKATKKPDEQFEPQQNWACNVSESSAQPANLPSACPTTTSRQMPDYRLNLGHQAHSHQFYIIPSMPPQMQHQVPPQMQHQVPPQMQHQVPPQMPMSPHMPMPYNTFNQYYPMPFVKYNHFPQHHNQYPQHRMQATQNMLSPAYQLNQNMATTNPSSSLLTEPDTNSPTMWRVDGAQQPSATTTLTALTDSQDLKRRNCGGEGSSFEGYKRPRRKSLTSTGNDSSPSNSPFSPQGDKEDNAQSAEKNDQQIDDKKALDPSQVVEEKYDFSCVICQEIKKDTVLFPCRHLCVCEKCSESVHSCPLCRKVFHETLTVFT